MAWAGDNHAVFEAIARNHRKILHGVIGTHRCCTSPEALRTFQDSKLVRMRLPSGVLFHPKIYLFEFDDRTVIVVGSHNLTMSAYFRNIEVGFVLTLPKECGTAH